MQSIILTIAEWLLARARLKAAKSDEARLRVIICGEIFPDAPKGTHIGFGGKLKLTQQMTYTLDTDKDKVLGAMAEISEAFPDLNLGELIEWKPKLNVTEYDALPDEARRIFNNVLTIKRAMPTLKLTDEKEND